MTSSNKVMWVAVAVVVGVALASTAYADNIYRSGRSRGVAMLTVEATSGRAIYEVKLWVLEGKVRTYRIPQGWSGEADGHFMRWWTADPNYRIPDGTSLAGFGVKVTGRGAATWQTYDVNGDFIDQGNVKLKGRLH